MEPLLLSCIESRVENSRKFYGRFQLGPFVLGQGFTIANSLRRSLLSEISGLAITAVEIEGVVHEYSTIEGVRESVLDILLNVKQIVLTSDFQIQEPQVAFLQVQGPGIVRAKDIKLPISIQSVDPEQYIATLLYDGLLKMKFMICRGKNYLVQTPLGLKIPNSPPPSYKKQEEPFSELKAEVFLTKSSDIMTPNITEGDVKKVVLKKDVKSIKQNLNYNPSLSKKSTESSFASFLQIENLQDPDIFKGDVKMLLKEEENNAAFTFQKSRVEITSTKEMLEVSGSNNDVTIDLSNNIQNEKKNSLVYPTSSEEALLNNNKAELSSLPNSEKKNTIDSKIDITSLTSPKVMSDVRQKQKKELKKTSNILPIDAVFMPINRVNFAIEPNNESEAPKDLVILEIWTNGSIHPKQAINEAAKALIQLIAPFQETKIFKSVFINSPKVLQKSLSSSSSALTNLGLPARTKKNLKLLPHLDITKADATAGGSTKVAKQESALIYGGKHRSPLLNKNIASLDIGNLDLSLRPYTCLKRAKIETVADLLQYSVEDLLNLKNFGKRSLDEIKQNLNQMGLNLRS
ncbi:MAG: DNA-directed RNA polymerase subunit alpha [Cyanobacteriota bacterium]|nr:MAG: DNA-directed RNA polymerase subunit alpha [Cyanobacteriota bacterium]